MVRNPLANARDIRDAGSLPGCNNPLEESTATHSSILAWMIPWTEVPGGGDPWGRKDWDTTAT